MHAGVGNLQIGCIEDQIVAEEYVEVQGAGTIGDAVGAVSAEITFDGEKPVEESAGLEAGFEEGGGVEKGGLVGKTDWGCFVIAGNRDDLAQFCKAKHSCVEGLTR